MSRVNALTEWDNRLNLENYTFLWQQMSEVNDGTFIGLRKAHNEYSNRTNTDR